MLQTGIKNCLETVVTPEMLAKNVGSGRVRVLATAMMIAFMEKTCLTSIEPYLEEGQGSVGTHVDISHCSATPVGNRIRVESELVEIDRRRLVFKVAAYDEDGLIGEGRHERFLIDTEKFQAKTDAKRRR